MINYCEKTVDVEMGYGDVCVTGGSYETENGKQGIVTFSDQKPREIGTPGEIEAGSEHTIGDFPVVITFAKKESIDVVIRMLQAAKREMEGEGLT
jgi:hypothetical protein